MTDPERTTNELQGLINGIKEANRLEGMWNSDYYNPEIPLDDAALTEFASTFAQTEDGQKIEGWVKAGASCEARHEEPHQALAQASVDWTGVTVSDSVLVCLEDLRSTYRRLMEDGRRQGLNPTLTVNGKEIPRIPAAELTTPSPTPES